VLYVWQETKASGSKPKGRTRSKPPTELLGLMREEMPAGCGDRGRFEVRVESVFGSMYRSWV
jgi:hypothetical protein